MLGMNRYRLRSRTGWKTLPPELQLKVHRLLPVQDLKSAVLVNKDWNRVVEHPSLWSWVVVKVRSREDIAKLSAKRLARLREIKIASNATFGTADWELFFQNLEKLAQVENIRGLGYRDLKGVDSSLLARALNGVEHVQLYCTRLTVQQLTSFFNHIQEQDTKIKKLELDQDLKGVDSGPLARALNVVEDVTLCCTQLTVQQLTSIFFHILEQDTKIKKLELVHQDLKGVDPGLLARAVNRLEDVTLWDTRLTVQQLTNIFNHILEQDTKIKKLVLARQDLKGVDPGLLARAVNRLEDVTLWRWDSERTSQQLSSIFHHIAEVNTKIKKLELRGLDLSGVPSDDLSVAISKLECVGLFSTKLTTAQLTSIMQHIVEKETKIKILNLRGNDLSAVDGNLLDRAINKLSESGGIIYHL